MKPLPEETKKLNDIKKKMLNIIHPNTSKKFEYIDFYILPCFSLLLLLSFSPLSYLITPHSYFLAF